MSTELLDDDSDIEVGEIKDEAVSPLLHFPDPETATTLRSSKPASGVLTEFLYCVMTAYIVISCESPRRGPAMRPLKNIQSAFLNDSEIAHNWPPTLIWKYTSSASLPIVRPQPEHSTMVPSGIVTSW